MGAHPRARRSPFFSATLPAGLLALSATATSTSTTAATSTSTRAAILDLSACIHRALERSPELRASAPALDAARAKLAEAKAGRFGDSEYRQFLGVVNRARGNPIFSPDSKDDVFSGLGPFTRLELDVDIPLWTFGRIGSGIEAAEHGVEAQLAGGRARKDDVVLETKKLYYQLVLVRQLAAVLQDLLDAMDKALQTTRERLARNEKGASEADLLQLRIGRAKLAKGYYELESAASIAKTALARAIGAKNGEDFEIADRKLQPERGAVEGLEGELAGAEKNRAALRALGEGVAAQAARVEVERSAYYPTIALALGVQLARAPNRDEQTNPFAWDEFNFVRPIAVLALRWNLNFFSTAAKVAGAEAELARLAAEEERARSGLAVEVQRAHAELLRAERTLHAAEDGSKAGRALMVSAVSSFELGFGEAKELFDALMKYAESHADYLHAVSDYNLALAALGRAVGRELSPLTY